jgi:hypothetical protein
MRQSGRMFLGPECLSEKILRNSMLFFLREQGDYIKTYHSTSPLYIKNPEKFGNYISNPKTIETSRRRWSSSDASPPPSTARGPKHC